MKSIATGVLTIFCVVALVSAALAADVEAGKAKAAVCAACHGPVGISLNGQWPNLAGQKGEYLSLQLKDFKDGSRKNALMSPQAATLSEDDIANLAAYYTSLKCAP